MKYIIEIAKEYEEYFKGILICGIADGKFAVDVIAREDLEELTSDYINEHYGDLQDEAYQRGLDDAWGAAKKICLGKEDGGISNGELLEIFKVGSDYSALKKYSASETIEKLKAYEAKQKADDKIEVGDEVERYIDGKFDSRGIYLNDTDEDGDYWNCLFWTGACFVTLAYPKNQFKKTGRHFDIGKILKEMQS